MAVSPSSAPRCLGCGGEVLQGAGAFPEQRAIPAFHGGADGFAQFLGHGERDQEVRHGQQPGALLREPRRGVVLPAARTGAVIAGVIREVFPAAGAAVALPAQRGRATPQNGAHGGALFGRDEPSELRRVRPASALCKISASLTPRRGAGRPAPRGCAPR